MRKLIKNPFLLYDDRPIIYIRYKNLKENSNANFSKFCKNLNKKKVCTYIGETDKFSGMRQFRKYLSPGIKDDYDEIRILYAPTNKITRLYWEAYLVVKLLPIYQFKDSKLKTYVSILNKRIMKNQGLIVEGTEEYVDLRNKYKGLLFHGGKIPLGYKVVPVPNTKSICPRTKEIKQIKVIEYDMDSSDYNMLMDIVLLYGKKNFESYKKMSYKNLSDYIQKKYNKKLAKNYIWDVRERELNINSKHWNKFYA
tara:strand:+ start:97 stop:855 length:759 start_codon:yes stop_codon:yes gene_type:complete